MMQNIHETWRTTKTFGDAIEVSNLGRVRRLERPLVYSDGRKGTLQAGLLSGTVMKIGYRSVSLGQRKAYVHRLVAEAFLPEPTEAYAYQSVNHLNGDKLDNRPENLEWSSHRKNAAHARDFGLNTQKGENCNLTKYGDQLIDAMKKVHAKYGTEYEELGRLFGMSGAHAGEVIRGESRQG